MKKQSTTNNIKVPNKNSAILKKNFPHCFDKNGNFDFDKFKQELSKNDYIDFSNESYEMDWLGKSYARLIASDEATTLLKEDQEWNKKEENVNSENLLIKGDNLEVLKHLSNAYYEGIKMIYIDPPYNTGSDGFVYQDDRKFSIEELSTLAGVDEEKAKRILDFTQSKSNSHSAWLTFMYPRLYIAKQLLKDDGVIFVSIDDNEVAQLRLLMDEIFGEENFIGCFGIENNPKGRKNADHISVSSEYCLVFAKQKANTKFEENIPKNRESLEKDDLGRYYTPGKRVIVGESSNESVEFDSPKYFSVYYNEKKDDIKIFKEKNIDDIDKEIIDSGYKRYVSSKNGEFIENTYTKSEFEKLFNSKSLIFKTNKIYEKDFNINTRIKSIITNRAYKTIKNNEDYDFKIDLKTETAGKILKEMGIPFDMPKNPSFIKLLLSLLNDKDFIVLDFFAGSGTTGDAVMQLNAEDGGNRKYILVQLPEQIDEKKNKTAYDFVKNELKIENPTIFEITKERLIRSAKKIQEDNKKAKEVKELSNVDFGFKVFETTPIWEDYNIEAENFDSQMELFDESKLTKEDLETLLTTWKTYDGFSLTQDLNKIDIDGYTAYYLDNKLYLMDKGFETKNLKKLLEEIDANKGFNPASIIVFGYNFQSKILREIADNVKNYANKKQIEIDLITRY